jgi:hypothetical protein
MLRKRVGAVLVAQAKVYSLPVGANQSGLIVANARELLGWWITTVGGVAGHFRIYDGPIAVASLICGGGQFVAGADSHEFLADQGYGLVGGGQISLQFVAAAAGGYEGCIYYA